MTKGIGSRGVLYYWDFVFPENSREGELFGCFPDVVMPVSIDSSNGAGCITGYVPWSIFVDAINAVIPWHGV